MNSLSCFISVENQAVVSALRVCPCPEAERNVCCQRPPPGSIRWEARDGSQDVPKETADEWVYEGHDDGCSSSVDPVASRYQQVAPFRDPSHKDRG